MAKLQQWIDKLGQVNQAKLDEWILEAVREHERFATDLNLLQLESGLNSLGKVLGKYKNRHYRQLKMMLNPKAKGNVDLKLEGNFYAGFYIDATKFPVEFNSHDMKTGKLAEGYDNIFGLSKKSKKSFRAFIKPYLIEHIRRRLLELQ
jgi:hypothetical protein